MSLRLCRLRLFPFKTSPDKSLSPHFPLKLRKLNRSAIPDVILRSIREFAEEFRVPQNYMLCLLTTSLTQKWVSVSETSSNSFGIIHHRQRNYRSVGYRPTCPFFFIPPDKANSTHILRTVLPYAFINVTVPGGETFPSLITCPKRKFHTTDRKKRTNFFFRCYC